VETLISIGKVLALFGAAGLCVYLIVVLMRLNGVLILFQRDFSEITRNLKPILENLNTVADRLKSITSKVDEQVYIFKSSLESFKALADNVVNFEVRVQERLEEPIIRVTALIGAFIGKILSYFGKNQAAKAE
jgi:ABC-type transporter Mla subunit MlaD